MEAVAENTRTDVGFVGQPDLDAIRGEGLVRDMLTK